MKQFTRISAIALLTITALSLLIWPGAVNAQAPDIIRAEVDRTQLSTDESLVLTITINGAGGSAQPILPPLSGFYVAGQSSSSQIQMVNGVTSSLVTYMLRLQPTQPGDLVIEPISITINGQTFTTDPIAISVSMGTGQNQAPARRNQPNMPTEVDSELIGQDFFVEAEVDNPSPYQGEQVVYTFRFYQAVNLTGRTGYQPPAFSGFWHDQASEQNEYMVEVAGRPYRVTEIQQVLFPTVAGEIAIEPANLTIPGGFFSSSQTLATEDVTLDVRPLPAGAPSNFPGAVGLYDIQAEVDSAETEVNDTITLRVTIAGIGNIGTIIDPILPETGDWRSFNGETSTQTWYKDGKLSGVRVTDWVLVPTTAGEITIPAIEYSFFDLESETYQTLATEPIAVRVAPGATIQTSEPLPADSDKLMPVLASSDNVLRPIKIASAPLTSASTPLTQRRGYWLLWLVPVGLVAAQSLWQRRQAHLVNTVEVRRSKQAAKKAQQMLDLVERHPERVHQSAGNILTTYLSNRLGQNYTGMTYSDLSKQLLAQGTDIELVERVELILSTSEQEHYAPTGQTIFSAELMSQTSELIDDLERVWSDRNHRPKA